MFYRCPKCRELIAVETTPLGVCPCCETLLQVTPAPPPTASTDTHTATPRAATDAAYVNAWEEQGSSVSNFARTAVAVFRRAPLVFLRLREQQLSPRAAERYAYVCSLIGLGGHFLAGYTTTRLDPIGTQRATELIADALHRTAVHGGMQRLFLLGLLATPILAYLPVHLLAGAQHAIAWLLSATDPERTATPYELQFRASAFALTPILVLAVPGIGGIVAPGWVLAMQWISFVIVQRTSFFTGLLAIAIPAFMALGIAAEFTSAVAEYILTTH